jgi:hypothetical protein
MPLSWTLPNTCLKYLVLGSSTETYEYDPAGNLDVKADVDLNYNDATHAHTVTHIGTTQKYWLPKWQPDHTRCRSRYLQSNL